MTGPPARAGASSPTLDEVLLPVTEPITIEESARLIGAWEWAEGRFYQVIGGWVTSASRPAAQIYFDSCSQHHAWRARLWEERRPGVPAHLVPKYGESGPAIAGLAALTGDVERLSAYCRVVLPARRCRLPVLAETVLSHRRPARGAGPRFCRGRCTGGLGAGLWPARGLSRGRGRRASRSGGLRSHSRNRPTGGGTRLVALLRLVALISRARPRPKPGPPRGQRVAIGAGGSYGVLHVQETSDNRSDRGRGLPRRQEDAGGLSRHRSAT